MADNVNPMTPAKFSDADYVALTHLFSAGDISSCTKGELERFAVMLSRPKQYEHFGANSFPQICETVRTLLWVRLSEDQNVQAKKESRLALIISCVALLAGIIQAMASILQIVSAPRMAIQASASSPVRAADISPVAAVPNPPKSEDMAPLSKKK